MKGHPGAAATYPRKLENPDCIIGRPQQTLKGQGKHLQTRKASTESSTNTGSSRVDKVDVRVCDLSGPETATMTPRLVGAHLVVKLFCKEFTRV